MDMELDNHIHYFDMEVVVDYQLNHQVGMQEIQDLEEEKDPIVHYYLGWVLLLVKSLVNLMVVIQQHHVIQLCALNIINNIHAIYNTYFHILETLLNI